MFRGEDPVAFESTLERDFLIRQEFFSSVATVASQPLTLSYMDAAGRERSYTPDFLVTYNLGLRAFGAWPAPLLVEVKPRKQWHANWRKWSLKWRAAMRYAKEQGYVFHIHDESRIRDAALANIRFLKRYNRMDFPEAESRVMLDTIEQAGALTRNQILDRHFPGYYRAQGVAHIWHLLTTRRLDCDITQPLTAETELWLASHG